jgi:O-acetylhomoserine (thiol)-lyase
MSDKPLGIETLALHAGQPLDCQTGSRAVPIYQTTSYAFQNANHAANLFALKEFGYIYSRIMNPTNEVLENRLAAMHGGTAGLVTASGMAAIFYAVAAITEAGQNIVSSTNLYGGTTTLFAHTLKRMGIEVRFVDSSNSENFARAIDGNTRLLYMESIGNPRCNVDDIAAVAKVAHDRGLPLIMDNTVAPPPIFNPFEHGADIVVYSLTKMLGGHGNSIAGAIVEQGGFDWSAGGKYPEITTPDPSYHGVNFWESFNGFDGQKYHGMAYALKVRCGLLRDTGACLSPFNSFLILQGVETLPLRARAHCANAMKVAEFLKGHPAVTWVNYAALPDHKDFERAKKYFPLGPSAVFGFGVRGGVEAGRKFINAVKLCSHVANILDAKTLVIHPASTTHSQLEPKEQIEAGVPPDLVRISVGLETAEDIMADLGQALEQSQR